MTDKIIKNYNINNDKNELILIRYKKVSNDC